MTSPAPRSEELFARAQRIIPGGVNSPVRAFRSVGGTPRFIASARGPYLIDEDGNELVDLVCSWGPMLLGHAHPEVLAAVTAAASKGTSYGAPTRAEVELAELIIERTPVQQVRLVNSGTEATMSVIRLARGITGRAKIIKFAGCYHGHVDALLVQAGSGLLTLADDRAVVPSSPGIPEVVAADTIVVDYNDRDAVSAAFAAHPDQIAAVITEAVPGNTGLVEPSTENGEHFNAFLARTARERGALFISDEVMTGFRVSARGQFGRDGVVPDLMTFGKVMGGGFPAAAFGGRAELMAHLSPVGGVYQAGTLSGNPVASAAGATTLRLATPELYRDLEQTSSALQREIAAALSSAGVAHSITTAGSMFSVFLWEGSGGVVATGAPSSLLDQPGGDAGGLDTVASLPTRPASGLDTVASLPTRPTVVRNARDASQTSTRGWAAFFHSMLDQGVYLPPSAFECWFLSSAHDDLAVARIVEALPAAARAAAQAMTPEAADQSPNSQEATQ